MIGLALSGGGSRAMAFHLGCLRALDDLGLLAKVRVISSISGGSVIGAYYAYTPKKSFNDFDSDICRFLRAGFEGAVFKEWLEPENCIPSVFNYALLTVESFFASLNGEEATLRRYPSRTDVLHKVLQKKLFPGLTMKSPTRRDVNIVVGACELRTGTAFRFGNEVSGGWRQGEIVDENVDVGFAVAASAAYPLFLPALDRTWKFKDSAGVAEKRVLLTDGGVYDNLGTQVLEPGRNAGVSIHTFPCTHLIVCNAGRGQDEGQAMPLRGFSRVAKSFEVVHRRVGDGSMKHLHELRRSGQIEGFVMPYLGQMDHSLPWKMRGMVSRKEVMRYPTDFSAMSDEWIDKLSRRGDELTRGLVAHYLSDLL